MTSLIRLYPMAEYGFVADCKPVTAQSLIPNWYRENIVGANTIKHCMPIFDAMSSGYFYLLPVDLHVNSCDENITFFIEDPELSRYSPEILSHHQDYQYETYPINLDVYHRQIIRINPLWAFGTPSGYSCLFTNPILRDPSPLSAVSGIIDTDTFISAGFLSFKVMRGFDGVIPKGTPIVQVIPFKRESWRSEEVTLEEFKKTIQTQHNKLRYEGKKHPYKDIFRSAKKW